MDFFEFIFYLDYTKQFEDGAINFVSFGISWLKPWKLILNTSFGVRMLILLLSNQSSNFFLIFLKKY